MIASLVTVSCCITIIKQYGNRYHFESQRSLYGFLCDTLSLIVLT